jgi:hypothetical protein
LRSFNVDLGIACGVDRLMPKRFRYDGSGDLFREVPAKLLLMSASHAAALRAFQTGFQNISMKLFVESVAAPMRRKVLCA